MAGRYFPDFMVIGPQRTGTRWLSEMMRHHPDTFMTTPREPHYFSNLREMKRDSSVRLQDYNLPAPIPADLHWYLDLFQYGNDVKRIGEASADYAVQLNTEMIRFIFEINPDIRIIFGVRDPVERAWSHVKWRMRRIQESNPGLSRKAAYRDSASRSFIIRAGFFCRHIEKWRSVIPSEQFFIFEYRWLQDDPVEAFARVCGFLEVGDDREAIGKWVEKVGHVNQTSGNAMPVCYRARMEWTYFREIDELSKKWRVDVRPRD